MPDPKQLREHSKESFRSLIDAIQALGFDRNTAAQYAAWVGDCYIYDESGLLVVRDDLGRVVARLALVR